MSYLPRLIFSIVALCLIATPLHAASGSIGVQPGMPRSDAPRSESIFVHTIRPSQTIEEAIKITNNSDKTQTVLLYGTDAITTNSGSFTCEQRAEKIDEAGSWLLFTSPETVVKPGQTVLVPFTITVPEQVDVGEHNACVALETKDDSGVQSGNLRIRTRSAIRVALTVSGELRRLVEINSFNVSQQANEQQYAVSVRNAGNVSADTRIKIQLSSLLGSIVYENGGEYPVLAGKTLDLSYKNRQESLFGGWYRVNVTATYDERPEIFGVSQEKHQLTVNGPQRMIFIAPRPLGVAIIGAVVAGFMMAVWRYILRRRDFASWKEYKIKPGQSIQTIAEKRHVSWKKIVRYNKIKPPYTLSEGMTIKLPTQKESRRES